MELCETLDKVSDQELVHNKLVRLAIRIVRLLLYLDKRILVLNLIFETVSLKFCHFYIIGRRLDGFETSVNILQVVFPLP